MTVSVNAPLPAAAVLGEIELSVGAGLLIVNVFAEDVPPPGVGVKTVTEAVPAAAMSAALIWAVSWPWLTNVVVRLLPFQRTTDEATKFDPAAVRVNAPLPTAAVFGRIELSVGDGFCASAWLAKPRTIEETISGSTNSCLIGDTVPRTMQWRTYRRQWLGLLNFMARSAVHGYSCCDSWLRLLRASEVMSLLGCRIDGGAAYCRGP